MLAVKPCLGRVLPRCHERPVTFSLPSPAAIGNGEIDEPPPQNVFLAMNAVTTALACGEITPGEAATIAGVYETFVRTAAFPRRRSPRAACCGSSRPATISTTRTRRSGMPKPATIATRRRRRPTAAPRQFVERALFNLEEKSSCRFLQMQEAESRRAIYG
jgi:hypothetical protein